MKRKTKEQREEEERAALRQRVVDMAVAADGDSMAAIDTENWFANAHCLSRLVPALKTRFGLDENGEERADRKHLWYPGNLHHFDDVETITNFLFDHGVRAK